MNSHVVTLPDATTGKKMEANEITDPRGYGQRWGFSIRKVFDLLAEGLPHLRVGKRRVRILVPEADAWMREQFGTQRRRPAKAPTLQPEGRNQ